jgi:hypothetical protein
MSVEETVALIPAALIPMQSALPELIRPWHDFYLLVGTASATLVGLMFVAASIGAQVFKEENSAAIRAFISPTVVHFSTALFICILATIPEQTGFAFVIMLSVVGLAGLAYSITVVVQLLVRRRFTVDMTDRLFYALIPCIGHLLVLLSGILMFPNPEAGLDFLAASLITLLIAGIRNAWDMTMWIVIKAPVAGVDESKPSSTS